MQEGSLKTGGSSKILTLPTESHRYEDKQTHTLYLQQVYFFFSLFFYFSFLKEGFIYILKSNLIYLELKLIYVLQTLWLAF